MPDPIRLHTELRERVWGRTSLAPWFPDPGRTIGEAWYLSEFDLPLLVKLIFTSERLSVQVHPDDGEDGPRGKSEMWHILDAEPEVRPYPEEASRRLWEGYEFGELPLLK